MFPLEKTLEAQLRTFVGPRPTLIFPEADDPRVITAASGLIQFAKVVLTRRWEELERDILDQGIPLRVGLKRFRQSVRCLAPGDEPGLCEDFAQEMARVSRGKPYQVDLETARRQARDPVYFAILAVRLGHADAVLGGVTHASRDFFQPCLRYLERDGTVYEMGLFALPDTHDPGFFRQNLVMFADVALNPEPSPERLADIAVGACVTMRNLIPVEHLPEVNGAILSYSTRGSGSGPSVDRVRGAEPIIERQLRALAADNPLYRNIHIATELQISCAISKDMARTKLGPEADLHPAVGASNVLIVSTLDTGNLLYHIYATRFPDAQSVLVIGGLRNQALDFSRSSKPHDIEMGAKALLLRMHRSGRFSATRLPTFFPRYRVLALGPHTAYTDVALWDGHGSARSERLPHDPAALPAELAAQVPLRRQAVLDFLARAGVRPADLDAVAARGGLVRPVESGTYRVDEAMLDDLGRAVNGRHVVNLGALLAHEVAGPGHPHVFIVDPPVVDELDETARLTGLPGVNLPVTWHALGQKAAAKLYADQHNREYEQLRLIVAFLGRGISVGAHLHGRCVKVRNALFDGPMSVDRAGSLPGRELIDLCFSGLTRDQVIDRVTTQAGLKAYLGTADFEQVERRVAAGEPTATRVWKAMVEQIAAEIASLVPKFEGEPLDQILLTGPLTHSQALVAALRQALAQLPIEVTVYPGSREMEALRDGALRVLSGFEQPLPYRPRTAPA
jgi:butyrate kinase